MKNGNKKLSNDIYDLKSLKELTTWFVDVQALRRVDPFAILREKVVI